MRELICTECGWTGSEDDVLNEPHPFQEGCICYGCPECLEIETFENESEGAK